VDSSSASIAHVEGIHDYGHIDWDYISGFFDGEGSVTVETRADLGVLVVSLTFSQKYRSLLEVMATFLRANGITCTVCQNSRTIHEIRIRRIESVCKLLCRINLILKQN
jgi:intein-encoded DNA endonuclease-like protein